MTSKIFELTIISPSSIQTEEITWVEIESPTGSFVVGYDHTPLVSLIKKQSVITFQLAQGQDVSLNVIGGVFSVSQNKAIVLLDQ